jgi:transposase
MQIQPTLSRHQLQMRNLEEEIEQDNSVRFIEAFVEKLDLAQLRFRVQEQKTEGRPSYNDKVFLKLYFYGYLNGIRSSRRLEKESKRNVELQWLLCGLAPNYHSIADFRKENPQALRNTFKLFVSFLKEADLITGKVAAIDGTKVRAHNSRKHNYSKDKIRQHLEYIETKTNEYLTQLEENDRLEQPEKVKNITEKIERLKQNQIRYELLGEQLKQSTETQISTTDPDARLLLVQGQVTEVSYNVQAAVDEKHKLVTATHTINKNDRNALHAIASEAKENINEPTLTILADKGYHNAGQLDKCEQSNITTIVATQELKNTNGFGTTEAYLSDKFTYNKEQDTYTCPQQQTLISSGKWHNKTKERYNYLFKKYRTPACKTCAAKHLCTGKAKGGREIERSQYAQAVENNAQRYKQNTALYRKRQEINEHIFGTIKRKWGYNHTNLTGLKKVNGEMALIMTVYNIKRTLNILKWNDLMLKLKNWTPDYKGMLRLFAKTTLNNIITRLLFFVPKNYNPKFAFV